MSEDIATLTAIASEENIEYSPLFGSVTENYSAMAPINVVETVFQTVLRHTITGNNNITTHYVENGINYEDVSTTDPLTITIQGWMAELFYKQSTLVRRALVMIAQTANIPIIGGFIATELSSIAFIVNSIYERLKALFETLEHYALQDWAQESGYEGDLITFDESKRLGFQLAVLEGLRQARTPIDIALPRVGVFHNMMLKNYEWDQDKSYYQAKITLTFQQIRNAYTLRTPIKDSTVSIREAEPSLIETNTTGAPQVTDLPLINITN